jgi:hypothetical protein
VTILYATGFKAGLPLTISIRKAFKQLFFSTAQPRSRWARPGRTSAAMLALIGLPSALST